MAIICKDEFATKKKTSLSMLDLRLADCFLLLSCLPYSPILTTEAVQSTATPIDFYRITRGYALEGSSVI
jgi:hypothetical protein